MIVDLRQKQYAIFNDTKASGTDGGTFTSGAWRTRDLNTTVVNNIIGASLSSNQITLPAGQYYVRSSCPAHIVGSHKAKIRDITLSADLIIGTSVFASNTDNVENTSICEGEISLTSTTNIELQHRCAVTVATNGFGVSSGFGVSEIYSQIYIEWLN